MRPCQRQTLPDLRITLVNTTTSPGLQDESRCTRSSHQGVLCSSAVSDQPGPGSLASCAVSEASTLILTDLQSPVYCVISSHHDHLGELYRGVSPRLCVCVIFSSPTPARVCEVLHHVAVTPVCCVISLTTTTSWVSCTVVSAPDSVLCDIFIINTSPCV